MQLGSLVVRSHHFDVQKMQRYVVDEERKNLIDYTCVLRSVVVHVKSCTHNDVLDEVQVVVNLASVLFCVHQDGLHIGK